MSDADIQTWLRKVQPEGLALALSGASRLARARVLRNMSVSAGAALSGNIRRYKAMSAKKLLIQSKARKLEEGMM
jgi:flagellar motor switch protein FliG